MHHRSIGVRLESLGKHSQQQMYPGIVFIGAAITQDSVGMLKFCNVILRFVFAVVGFRTVMPAGVFDILDL